MTEPVDVHDTEAAAELYEAADMVQGGWATLCAADRWIKVHGELPEGAIRLRERAL